MSNEEQNLEEKEREDGNDLENPQENIEVIEAKKKRNVLVFQLDTDSENFKKVDVADEVPLCDLLYHDLILFFIDLEGEHAYIWEGSQTKARQKFLSAQLAPKIRDQYYAIDCSITSVDDGDETLLFKKFCGLI